MEKKDILCPDCANNYISSKRFKELGKCISCSRRETIARTTNREYIKYVNLPQEEKDRLAHQRELNNRSAKLRNQKKVADMPKVEEKVEPKKVEQKQNTGTNVRKNQIYTPDIVADIKQIANDETSIKMLLQIICEKYPDKNFNEGNLKNIIRKYKLPHLVTRGNRAPKIEEEQFEQTNVSEPEEFVTISTVVDSCGLTAIPDSDVSIFVNNKSNEPKEFVEPERFKPIRAEVNSVLDKRFKNLGVAVERDYTTDEYINALDMLLYLKENCDTIIKNRRSQQNIMNAYQSDMIHTIENVIADEGDTYLSDKMHIIRDYRRFYEVDYKNVSSLKTILGKIDAEDLRNAMRVLRKNKEFVENPVFKPYVDTTLIDKYEWAQPIDPNSAKANVSITKYNPTSFNVSNTRPVTRIGMAPNTPPTSQLSSRVRKSLHTFRVSCRVSGGGYGVFKEWHRDYECTNKNTALAYATNTLNQLSSNRKGMIWTDLDVVELNVGTATTTGNT